jgi:acetolactate synthase-1/2/3 large subunit
MPVPTDQPAVVPLSRPPRNCADLIVAYLCQLDIEYVYGVPGGAIEPLFDALARAQRDMRADLVFPQAPRIRHRQVRSQKRVLHAPRIVVARHEAGAAFMADGYARETGKIGVVCATTGPGTTNLITAVASAYCDEVPMLVITPQTALPKFGKLGLQDSSYDAIDTVSMFGFCTRYNTLISHPDQLEGKLFAAITSASRGPRGPAHLSIPMDLMTTPVGDRAVAFHVAAMMRQPSLVDERALDELSQAIIGNLLEGSNKIVLFIGQGCGETTRQIIEFAEQINAEFVTTPMGKRWVNSHHPLYRGVFGFAGHDSARACLMDENVSMVVAVGADFGELSTNGWDQAALMNEKLVHIDTTMKNFEYSPMASLHVCGSLDVIFNTLLHLVRVTPGLAAKLAQRRRELEGKMDTGTLVRSQAECMSSSSPLHPARVMRELTNRLPVETRFLIDAGNSWCWATHFLHPKQAGAYRIAMGYGAMGWAIGAAVGTAHGAREVPVVCITGDGSYLMNGQEITTAVAEGLGVIYVVLNDQALGMVKHGQRMGGAERVGYQLPPVDFAAMARACGVEAYTVVKPEDFDAIDFSALSRKRAPTLIDVRIDAEVVPPMGSRVRVLAANRNA